MRYFALLCVMMLWSSVAQARTLVTREMSSVDNLHIVDTFDDGTVEIMCIPPDCDGQPVAQNVLSQDGLSVSRILDSGAVVVQTLPAPLETDTPPPDPTPDPEPPPLTLIEINATEFASNSGWVFDGTWMQTMDSGVLYATEVGPYLRYDISALQGQYYLWVFGRGPNGNSDSVWYGIDGQNRGGMDWWSLTSQGKGGWMGTTREGGRAILNLVGGHTLDIWAREDGMRIEKIIVTTDEGFVP